MKKLLLIASFLCTVFMVSAQQVYVQGIVTDSSGNGVPNVNLIISNPISGGVIAIGAPQTDANGSYWWVDSLNVLSINQPGSVDVSVADCNGTIFTQSLAYTPNQLSLTANFSPICTGNPVGSNCGVNIPLPFVGNGSVSISANGTGGIAPYTYLWDMGDGTTQTTQTANHTYAANGTYSVCVTLVDATGCVATQCMNITITGATGGNNCSVSMQTYQDTSNYLTHDFYAQAGSGSTFPITYLWDFGDGNTSTVANPIHTYSTAGIYHACVTITDANGCIATDCDSVAATQPQNCGVSFNYSPPSISNPTIHFSANGFGTGILNYSWNFGDGNTGVGSNPLHTYGVDSTYFVCVTMTDTIGCTSTFCDFVTVVTPVSCYASFTANNSVANPNTFVFTPYIPNNSTQYLWDFGDGTLDSMSTSPTHTYGLSGTYYPCLYTIDLITGCIATHCDTIAVGTPTSCQAAIQYANTSGSLSVDFFGSSTGTAPFVYDWNFGDGTSSIVQNPTHLYNTFATGPVSFNITLTVTDVTGCTSVATEVVTVFGGITSGQIIGYLWKDTLNFTPADGLVYLIEYDSTNGSLTAIDTVQTQQGLFTFTNVPMGNYLVKGALEPIDPDYANYLPTYFVQSLSWGNAQYVGPVPFGLPAFIDLQLVAGNNPGGAGFIGGLVVNGAGRPISGNQTLIENVYNMEPIEGASVLLLDANGNAITHTTTDETGAYSFNGIAMGTYNVRVEEVGKVTFPATVVVDADNMSHSEIHFSVHETMVTLTGVYEVSNIEGLNVFPNPVNDAATVQIELAEAMDLTLSVTNLMGQEVINTNKSLFAGENTFSVEMNDLPAGLYLMSLKSGSDIVTYKIQKN